MNTPVVNLSFLAFALAAALFTILYLAQSVEVLGPQLLEDLVKLPPKSEQERPSFPADQSVEKSSRTPDLPEPVVAMDESSPGLEDAS